MAFPNIHSQRLVRKISIYIFALLILWLAQGCSGSETESAVIAENEIDTATKLAANYLANSVKDDGMFVYRVNMNPSVPVAPRYNILRHGGTIYAMSSYYDINPNPEMLAAIKRTGNYLLDQEIFALPDNENIWAVWSRPEVNRSRAPLQAKLGGTGLGLVALASIEKIDPGFAPRDTLEKLGEFILYMQKEDGSFYSKYFDSAGRSDAWTSLYYPGEAALGLLMLYEFDRDERWLEGSTNALLYLAKSRQGQTDIPADHWALIATEKLFSIEGQPNSAETQKLLVDHAMQISESILASQILENENDPRYGGFSPDGRTTPAATRLEGLLAAYAVIPQEQEISESINNAVKEGIRFLLASQIVEGQFTGGIPRIRSDLHTRADIEQTDRAGEIRVDYVQHYLSALIEYREIH